MLSTASCLITLLVAAAVSAVAAQAPSATAPEASAEQCGSTELVVGSFSSVTYIDPPVTGEGVSLLTLTLCPPSATDGANDTSATLWPVDIIPTGVTGENPSFCDQYDAETVICGSGDSDNGTAVLLGVGVGAFTMESEVVELGTGQPTHIAVLRNGLIATVSYGGGIVTTFDPSVSDGVNTVVIAEDNATLDAGDPDRQEAPHPHQVLELGDGMVLVPDLGSDSVWYFTVGDDGAMEDVGATSFPAGSGPRHAALGAGGKVYVAAELSLQVMELGSTCTVGAEGTALGICSTVDIPTTTGSTFTSAAAIRVSKDQKFLYVSLRTEEAPGEEGGIVGFALREDGSVGEVLGTWGTGGQQPRDFALVEVPGSAKEVVVVSNRKSNDVTVFDRDAATGVLGAQLATASVNSPVSVLPLQQGGVHTEDAISPVTGLESETASVAPVPAQPRPTVVPTGLASSPMVANAPVGAAPLSAVVGAAEASEGCGAGGQPVCEGDQMAGRRYECDFGFEGQGGICVPYTPPAAQPAAAPRPGALSSLAAPTSGSLCGGEGQPVCQGEQLAGRRRRECDHGFAGSEDGRCVSWTMFVEEA